MVMSASALAQGLPSGISPSMIETLKRMPAAQQKALAEQYGIDLPQSAAPSIATEAVTNVGQVTAPEQQVVSAPKVQKTSRVYGLWSCSQLPCQKWGKRECKHGRAQRDGEAYGVRIRTLAH